MLRNHPVVRAAFSLLLISLFVCIYVSAAFLGGGGGWSLGMGGWAEAYERRRLLLSLDVEIVTQLFRYELGASDYTTKQRSDKTGGRVKV